MNANLLTRVTFFLLPYVGLRPYLFSLTPIDLKQKHTVIKQREHTLISKPGPC